MYMFLVILQDLKQVAMLLLPDIWQILLLKKIDGTILKCKKLKKMALPGLMYAEYHYIKREKKCNI